MSTLETETETSGGFRYPRFYVWQAGDGRWTWGYQRPGERPPAGVRLKMHTKGEAEEVVARLNREAERLAADPTGGQGALDFALEAGGR